MFGAEYVKRVPVLDRNGNQRTDTIGRPMWRSVYDPPKSLRPAHQREGRRREQELFRQDVQLARAAENWGREASERYQKHTDAMGSVALLKTADLAGWTREQRRERIYGWDPEPQKPGQRKRGPTVLQTVCHAVATESAKEGTVDPGAHERNFGRGLAGQIIEHVRDPADRYRVGAVMERAHTGQMHPRDIQRLANETDIHNVVAGARRMDRAGLIAWPQRRFTPELRETLRYLIRQPERKVALNGSVHVVR